MTNAKTSAEFFSEFDRDPEYGSVRDALIPHTNLAINVNRLRRQRGWTQAELGRAAGMRQPRIADIERGDANPRLDTLVKIAQAFGVAVDLILADPTDKPDEYDEAVVVRLPVTRLERVYGGSWSTAVVGRESALIAAMDNFCLEA